MNNLLNYFSYYYKKHNYEFISDYDKEIITNCKPYNELWKFCPCDYRFILLYRNNKYFYCMFKLIKYYLLLNHSCMNKNKINNCLNKLKNEDLNIKIPETLEDFKKEYLIFFSDYLNNDEIYYKIYNIFKKYYNEKYFNIITDINIKSINKYFSKFKINQIIIDFFNILTWFYYEKDLDKFIVIKKFIKYIYNIYFKNNLLIFNIPYECILIIYDIILYINIFKNIDKYKYHIIYNGNAHLKLFNEFMLFLKLNNYEFK